MTTPPRAGRAGSNFDQVQDHGLVWAEHSSGGDPKKQGVTDLAGGAGYCDPNGSRIHSHIKSG